MNPAELDPNVWTEDVARGYDESSASMYAPAILEPTVDFLAERASGGPALEFAIGTGRVALPLSERGLSVSGIEFSRPMADELSRKPGGNRIPVIIGDMATARVDGRFSLVYLVYNGITNLLTQQGQVDCFRNAAGHLRPGGAVVMEVFVPNLRRLIPGDTMRPFHVSADHLGIDEYDTVNQLLVSHHYNIADGRASTFRSPHRFVWPSELDLMAQLADLELIERWADWQRTPFTAESESHVSVWRKPAVSSTARPA